MKITKVSQILTMAVLAAGAAGLLSGCGTTSGYQQADKVGAGISSFSAEIVNGKKAVDDTVKALDQVAVSASTDPRPAFEQFSKSVTKLEDTAARVRKRGQEMQQQGAAYFKQWQEQLGQVKSEEVRKLAEQRKAKLQESFDSIKKYSDPLKEQFDPWMSDLKDLKNFLGNDLTVSGVDSAKSLFAKGKKEGMEIQKLMDGLIAELNTIAATLTAAKPPPKP